ncbi:MAG: argininosuccinate lyase [Lentisphaerae bacterium]|jgi:argininosuccinate lyase|nr:argininosuccinate lyase [Lentisphaerota bacterium]
MKKSSETKTVVGDVDSDVLSFTVGKDPVLDLKLVEWDCLGSAAHVTMLSRMKVEPPIFTSEERDAIVKELANIAEVARAGKFVITEADQDCHLAIERTLTEKLGDLGRRIHTGRSRNDQVSTALRLYMRDQLLGAMEEMMVLARALNRFAKKHEMLPMVGRTHFQPAMPSTVGVWSSCYAEALLDDIFLMWAAYDFADSCPLGSAASYGVPLPIDRILTSKLLGFREPVHNVMYAGNSRGKTESVAVSALCQVMLSLSRLAEDLVIFSAPEFGYFKIPREFCTGSSIMPQKYNPDVCELIRAKSARLIGMSAGIASLIKAMAGGYNRDLQDSKEMLMESFDASRKSLRIMARLIDGLKPVPDKLRAAFSPEVFATDRALELVAGGMPFRDAYHQVRDNLDELKAVDPDDAAAAKTHLGATAGLDLAMLREAVNMELKDIKAARSGLSKSYKKLMDPLA